MKKYGLILIILLSVSVISMVWMNSVEASPGTDLLVNPQNVMDSTLQPNPKVIVRPSADSLSGNTYWTKRNLKLMPDGDGSKSEWNGRILTINPSGKGKYTEWNSSLNLSPNDNGNYTNWDGIYSWWNELDGAYVYTDKPNQNETSNFKPTTVDDPMLDVPKTMPILSVKLTMTATANVSTNEKARMMLALPFFANVSGRVIPPSGWSGWSKNGSSPWLDKADWPTNTIYTSVSNDKIGNFTFPSVPSGMFQDATPNIRPLPLKAVTLCIKTSSSGGHDILRVYLYNGTGYSKFEITPRTSIGPGLYEVDVSSVVRTESAFNNVNIAFEKITVGADADTIYIDQVRLRVAGVRYRGLTTTLTTVYPNWKNYTCEWPKNPLTGSAWTWLDIVMLEAGVESVQVGWESKKLMIDLLLVSVITGGLYTDWNDWPAPNGDTNYVFASAGTKLQSSALTNCTFRENWTIAKVRVYFVARANITTGASVTLMLVLGASTAYSPTSNPLGTAYTEYSWETSTKPGGGSWNWADINATEAGVKSGLTGKGELRVTQLYVKVIESPTPAYTQWAEATPDGDATYLSAISGNKIQVSNLENHPASPPFATIKCVQVSVVARLDVPTSDEKLAITLGVWDGLAYWYDSPDLFAPSSSVYKTFTSMWTENPVTFTSWSWNDIDTLQAGVTSAQWGSTWTGEIRVTQIYVIVSEDGSWADWKDTTPDGDATYLSATRGELPTGPFAEVSQLTDPTPSSWNPARVRVVIGARVTDASSDEKIQPLIAFSGSPITYTPLIGTKEYTLTTDYVNYTGDWGINPSTKLNWTWTDINNLEAGVQSILGADNIWTGEIRVTQMFVEVAGPWFSVGISVTNVYQLLSLEFQLNYNTAVLSATSIAKGSMWPSNAWVPGYEINDAVGYVKYIIEMPRGSRWGINGSGTLATLFFIPDSYGSTILHFAYTKLNQYPSGQIIPDHIYDGYFNNKIAGDINADKKVATSDLSAFSTSYGSALGKPNWNIDCDFNRDNVVNATDLFTLGKNFGRSA